MDDKYQPRALVLLIHGLFFRSFSMALLRSVIKERGFAVELFSYPSVRMSPPEVARRLAAVINVQPASTIHFVAHSLGGLVVRHLFAMYQDPRYGRVVTLGTPHRGSDVARRLEHSSLGRMMLGQSYASGLSGFVPDWRGGNELGVIAGDLSVGAGRLVKQLQQPNDGTVTVEETRIAQAKDHITLHVSHTSMLCSRAVGSQILSFLEYGAFDRRSASCTEGDYLAGRKR